LYNLNHLMPPNCSSARREIQYDLTWSQPFCRALMALWQPARWRWSGSLWTSEIATCRGGRKRCRFGLPGLSNPKIWQDFRAKTQTRPSPGLSRHGCQPCEA